MKDEDLNNLFNDIPKGEGFINPPNNIELKPENELVINNDHILSEQDKLILLKFWEEKPEDPPSIEEMCEKIRPGKNYDGRSKLGREIKKYISSLNLPPPKTKTEYEPKGLRILTEEEKEYIKNNPNMTAAENACALWNRPFFANNSVEVRTILNYQKELENEGNYKKEVKDDEISEEYRPPKTHDHVVARINKYIKDSGLVSGKLNAGQKKCCQMLISYLHSYRLNHQVNSFSKQEDRDLFESVFVSYCYDKPDLTREDIDKMVILATESVISANKLRMIELLQNEMQKSLDENNNVKIGIVDSISTINTEYNSSVKRQRDLYNDLNEKRSERLKGKLKETASVLNLVELWKNEETRNKMIKIANQKKEKLKEEIDRLTNMDDIVCMVAGLDRSEVLNN